MIKTLSDSSVKTAFHPRSAVSVRAIRSLGPLLLVVGFLFAATQTHARVLAEGDTAPNFSLRDINGTIYSLYQSVGNTASAKLRHFVLLDFFSMSCRPCKRELPKVVEFYKRFRDRGVTVFLVALPEQVSDKARIRGFLTKNPVPFPVLLDSYENVAKKYIFDKGSAILPTLLLIGPDAKVKKRIRGLKRNLNDVLLPVMGNN